MKIKIQDESILEIQPLAELIATFLYALNAFGDSENAVDMGEIVVDHKCKTPMCHAGWYAAIVTDELDTPLYDDGSRLMAKLLGFDSEAHISDFMHFNEEIWGNPRGKRMFSNNDAFFDDESDANISPRFGLQVIIDHWSDVAKRIYYEWDVDRAVEKAYHKLIESREFGDKNVRI